jgi:hypothetical protein
VFAKDPGAASVFNSLREPLFKAGYCKWFVSAVAKVETTEVRKQRLEEVNLGAFGFLLHNIGREVRISQESGFGAKVLH